MVKEKSVFFENVRIKDGGVRDVFALTRNASPRAVLAELCECVRRQCSQSVTQQRSECFENILAKPSCRQTLYRHRVQHEQQDSSDRATF